MSVPSHNLYDFIHQVAEKKFLVFFFYPWGEKDYTHVRCDRDTTSEHAATQGINGLSILYAKRFIPDHLLDDRAIKNFQPVLFCHDQEPLDFEFYQDEGHGMKKFHKEWISQLPYPVSQQNLRSCHLWSWHKKWILLHTEKNSKEVEKYENTGRYRCAFWWSHALLARDWYRYAQHDPSLHSTLEKKTLFLVYARDSSGSREYRKKILDALEPIKQHCQIGSTDNSLITSESSASYNSLDFVQTEISLILETLFEDPRIYLTEKTLRPLACGHPFILAAGPGSLEFLKGYGFETFHPWINETYDSESDHNRRREMIVKELYRIASLDATDKNNLIRSCQEIAERNKKRFFSIEFENSVISELSTNIKNAYAETQDKLSGDFRWEIVKWKKQNGLYNRNREPTYAISTLLTRHCRVNHGSLEQYQRHQHSLDDKSSTNGDDV